MKSVARIVLPILGVVVIIAALSSGSGSGRSGTDFFLTLLLGGTQIVSPFLALGMLFMYAMMLLCIIGGPLLGAYIGVQIGGKDSAAVWIGLIVGGYVGIKFGLSDSFGKLMRPAEGLAKLDDEDRK
jgi:hypothetical protein